MKKRDIKSLVIGIPIGVIIVLFPLFAIGAFFESFKQPCIHEIKYPFPPGCEFYLVKTHECIPYPR